jgi:hypothetical protein
MHATTEAPASWRTLLEEAASKPGSLSAAYSAFHRYSIGNQLLAMFQCAARELPLGPICTYKGWQAKGRQVQKGQRALTLCMPITVKHEDDDGTEHVFTRFTYKKRWFVLSQTEGDDYAEPAPVPGWDRSAALNALGVDLVPFEHADGNCQGYAVTRQIAVNPVAALPQKTTFHELAHVVLGHTSAGDCSDAPELPRSLREVEAESVAYILTSILGLPGQESARAYIQGWLQSDEIPEASARRIFGAAQEILEAGQAA